MKKTRIDGKRLCSLLKLTELPADVDKELLDKAIKEVATRVKERLAAAAGPYPTLPVQNRP